MTGEPTLRHAFVMRSGLLGACLLALVALAGCSPNPGDPAPPGPGEYLAGHEAVVDLPADPRAVVVLVPGGGWSSADPTGLRPLAAALAEAGLAVVTVTYGTSSTGDIYPRPVDDVACAVAFAAQEVPDLPVVLVGHSAGAHLVLVAGLRPDRDDPECPYPARAADAVVGMAGPYDVVRAANVAVNLFGVPEGQDPDLWREGNPYTWTGERPELPILLVHGDADSVVPLSFTSGMAEALEAAGHPVTVEVVPGDHNDIFLPEAVADLLVAWVLRTVVIDVPTPV